MTNHNILQAAGTWIEGPDNFPAVVVGLVDPEVVNEIEEKEEKGIGIIESVIIIRTDVQTPVKDRMAEAADNDDNYNLQVFLF